MKIQLTNRQVNDLTTYIERKLSERPCDHSLSNAIEWAKLNDIGHEDFIDILEFHGGFCDCEVVLNLPEDCDAIVTIEQDEKNRINPWQLPINFEVTDKEKLYTNFLISKYAPKNKCYAQNGELLVPAPKGSKPKKRIRKSVHFFMGLDTGLPNEIGFIQSSNGITAREFAKRTRGTAIEELKYFREEEAAFFLSKLEKLKQGDAVATHFTGITGLTEKREELRVHKVIFRK